MSDGPIRAVLWLAGAFAVVLGLLHFTFPRRFGVVLILEEDGLEPPPFRLGPYRKAISRSDVLGIVYVMNHCVSFVIVSIGVFDLCVAQWLGSAANIVSLWCCLFWWLRAGLQLYLGRRRGDWFVLGFFAALGAVQLLPMVA